MNRNATTIWMVSLIVGYLASSAMGFAAEKAADTAVGADAKSAASQRYRLVEGKGYTVCEAFLKNLNSLPMSEPPMVCEVRINHSKRGFLLPRWEPMDVERNLRLVHAAESQLIRFTRPGTKPPPYTQWLETFRQRVMAGELKPRLSRTVLAINERVSETFVRYEPYEGSCNLDTSRASNGALINYGPFVFLLRPSDALPLQQIESLTPDAAELFIYNGRPFFLYGISDFERIGNGLKPVWYIGVDHVRNAVEGAPGNPYIRGKRCAFKVDRESSVEAEYQHRQEFKKATASGRK